MKPYSFTIFQLSQRFFHQHMLKNYCELHHFIHLKLPYGILISEIALPKHSQPTLAKNMLKPPRRHARSAHMDYINLRTEIAGMGGAKMHIARAY